MHECVIFDVLKENKKEEEKKKRKRNAERAFYIGIALIWNTSHLQ